MLSAASPKKLWLAILQILCFCAVSLSVSAQNTKHLNTRQIFGNTPYYSRQQVKNIDSATLYTVKPAFSFTSLAVNTSQSASFMDAYVIVGQDTFFLREDEHQPEVDTLKQSVLLIFDEAQTAFVFYTASIRGEVSFSLFNAERGRDDVNKRMEEQKKKNTSPMEGVCEEPEMIHTSVWRDGLPEPSYNRIETDVAHVIVHHSAGSNTNTDYVNVVRNIYLFHTQERGWSDIGYNYLIAQDGTIFQGRSFSDDQLENDNIQGAHFCGQNSRTMGICMLGNYNTAIPSTASVISLVQLTAWKLNKESLNPLVSSSHPANSNLGVIAGHRNGCATECPGDNLYALLDDIRPEVAAYLETACGEEVEDLAFNVYPVPAEGKVNITFPPEQIPDEIWLIDAAGKKFNVQAYEDLEEESWVVETDGLATGVYILQLSGEGFEEKRKLLIR